MATDVERLVVQLSADIKKYENALNKASGLTNKRVAAIEAKFAAANKSVSSSLKGMGDELAGFGKAKIGGIVGSLVGAGIGGLLTSIKQVADGIAEIGSEAKMAGLSAKAFQEWKYVAEQARIPVDAITDGLKELSLRADEFAVTGKGSAAESFQRLGMSPEDVKQRLENPTELMLTLIERTRLMKDTAAGVRIFDELFGGQGGERMVSLIEQGEAGIRSQMKAANDFGRVLSDDVIAKAAEIDRQFNQIAGTIGTTLKSAIVSAVASVSDFIDGLRAIDSQRSATIQSSINDIMSEKQAVARALSDLDSADNRMNDRQKVRAKGAHEIKMRQLNEQENALIKELENRPEVMSFTPKNSEAWKPAAYVAPPPSGSKKRKTSSENEFDRETAQIKDRTAALQAETVAQAAITSLVDDYGYSMSQTQAAQDLLTSAQKAGLAAGKELSSVQQLLSGDFSNLTPAAKKQAEAMLDMAGQYAVAVEASNKLAEKQDEIRRRAEDALGQARDAVSGIADGFLEGEKAADIFAGSLKRIGKALIDDVINNVFSLKSALGSGGSGGWLSGLFGLFGGGSQLSIAKAGGIGLYRDGGLPRFATGTPSKARPGLVRGPGTGTSDSIVARISNREFITNARSTAKYRDLLEAINQDRLPGFAAGTPSLKAPRLPDISGAVRASTAVNVTYAPKNDMRGASVEAVARLQQAMAQDRADLEARVVSAIRTAKSRGARGL